MKRLRVTYFKSIDRAKVPGVGGSAGSAAYVFDGFKCNDTEGGGFVEKMYKVDGAIRVYKRDAKGQPFRSFGRIAVPGVAGFHSATGDFVDIPLHLVNGYVCVEEEEAEQETRIPQDPPPAKPTQPQRR